MLYVSTSPVLFSVCVNLKELLQSLWQYNIETFDQYSVTGNDDSIYKACGVVNDFISP